MKNTQKPEQTKIKYLCVSGDIFTRSGAVIHIKAQDLPEKYRINPDQCIFVEQEIDLDEYELGYLKSLELLTPRSDGDYVVAEEKSPIILPKGYSK